MKRKLIPFILLVSTIFFVSSCLGDGDEGVVYTNEVGITAFSLGTQKYVRDTIASTGADSTYQTTLDCSSYLFYIDQTKREIYNPDSLPVGIDSKKIICTVTSKSSSVTLIKNVDSDTLQSYSSSDSIDFSQARTFRMVSQSGLATVDYTIKVNVHQQKPEVFEWKQATECHDFAHLAGMRALAVGGKVYIVGSDGSNLRIYSAAEDHVVSWTEITPNVELDADCYKNMAVMAGKFYVYSDGALYTSADAQSWTQVASVSLSNFLGCSNKRLYASNGSTILSSADGATWTAEELDTPADSLPTGNYSLITRPVLTNPSASRVILIGTGETTTKIWSKIEETDNDSEPQPWAYLDVASDNRFRLPNMANLQITYYDTFMMAMGGLGTGDSQGTAAFSTLYGSTDGGMTWRTKSLYTLPAAFNTQSNTFAFVADSQNYLWIVDSTGRVWRGRLNRLGWQTGKTYFGE